MKRLSLKISNVSKTYRSKYEEKQVLYGVEFEIKSEEFVCILGHSGCGKSTPLL